MYGTLSIFSLYRLLEHWHFDLSLLMTKYLLSLGPTVLEQRISLTESLILLFNL
jgi:hypothetical protein